jgi:hypothetical protein
LPKLAYGHSQPEERKEADYYPTPDPLALACCKRLFSLVPDPNYIIEPSAGGGAFVRAARATWVNKNIVAIEVRHEEEDQLHRSGADNVFVGTTEFAIKNPAFGGVPLVVGNPPYSLAQVHIMLLLDYLLPGSHIAFLLKLGFLGTKTRADLLWKQGQCKYLIPILGRPSFVKGEKSSSDVNEYGLIVWEVGYEGPMTVLFPHIRWKKGDVCPKP